MYPPLQCHAHGWLAVGEGHEIYWEVCGNPMGAPALFVHGGPGAGCAPDDRRWFDPSHYRIVLFDQRGAGRSRPQGEVRGNTTDHLVRDIEALRAHLQIERWLLFGGSWGATLSLAYAQRHPQRVSALVLRGVFTATVHERCWLYTPDGAALVHPAAWQRLTAAMQAPEDSDVIEAAIVRLNCGDAGVEQAAAQAWLQWEQDLMDFEANEPAQEPRALAVQRSSREPAVILAAARIGAHFAQHGFFLREGELLRQAAGLRAVPGVIMQGMRDLVTPPPAAQALHRAWPASRLLQLESAGHASSDGAMAQQLIAATDRFRSMESSPA
jgi:proline iminopeptidase